MLRKYLAAALLLLAGCKSPAERAQLAARRMLAHELAATAQLDVNSLKVYPFPSQQVRYFTADVAGHGDGQLVTYDCRPAGARQKFAVFVSDADSAFFFVPFQHADEFRQRYGAGAASPPARRR